MKNKALDGDRAYPVYKVNVRWTQDIASGEDYSDYPTWTEGLPEGRFRNASGFTKMYESDPGLDEVMRYTVDEWWPMMLEKKDWPNPGEPEITLTGPRWETWCLAWFEHWTFDDGRTSAEYLESFERYVCRYEYMQDWSANRIGEAGTEFVSLMGAEDRWRWHGSEDGSPDSRIDPPCRCPRCKEHGVIRIGH